MEISTRRVSNATLIALAGDLEPEEMGRFESEIEEFSRRKRPAGVVLDLSGVTRMTSYAVALVGWLEEILRRAGGGLVLVGAGAPALRHFELSGLDKILRTAGSVEEALKLLGG